MIAYADFLMAIVHFKQSSLGGHFNHFSLSLVARTKVMYDLILFRVVQVPTEQRSSPQGRAGIFWHVVSDDANFTLHFTFFHFNYV